MLGTGIVPPNNQGIATRYYNQGNNGENPAKPGAKTEADLDRYTKEAIKKLSNGYVSFAGQRDDGFYADIQSIFDLLSLRNPGKDSQGGFNIHLMALEIPVSELGGDQTGRRRVRHDQPEAGTRPSREQRLGRYPRERRRDLRPLGPGCASGQPALQ